MSQGLQVLHAGQDITDLVEESSIDIQLNLAAWAGAGDGGGQASQCSFLARLGNMGTAVGAGTVVGSPRLVRQGEVIIKDVNGNVVFGGVAVSLDDNTIKKSNYTKITACDYFQALSQIVLQNELYSGKTDIYIINDLLRRYAPDIDRSTLPNTGNYTFNVKRFQSVTLMDAIQSVANTAGWMFWITPNKKAMYSSPLRSQSAPFALSDSADMTSSFYCAVDQFTIDDSSAINRVYFYGGNQTSKDFTQDLSVQANGSNKKFLLAYYPKEASDGAIHVGKNGADLVIGKEVGNSNDADNVLKSDGGNADVLINSAAKTLTFDVAPTAASLPYATYRYEFPLTVIITDEKSRQFYGKYLDATISDNAVIDVQTAIQRCRILLLQNAYGLKTLQVRVWRPGIQPGNIVRVDHYVRGIHESFVCQSVEITPLGAGNFVYTVTLGAWNWNMVDLFLKLIKAVTPEDTSTQDDSTPIQIETLEERLALTFSMSTTTSLQSGAHCGQSDAHSGFCTVA